MRELPRNALHGPWRWTPPKSETGHHDVSKFFVSRMTLEERISWRSRIEASVMDGTCDCYCCKIRGECKPLPKTPHGDYAYSWVRQPTPKQVRKNQHRFPLAYLHEWPTWIWRSV